MLVWRKRFDEVCDKSAKYEFGYLIYTLIEKFSKVSTFNLEVRLQSAVVTRSKFVGRILTHFFPTILNNYCNCNTITFVRCTIFQLENVIITFDDGVYTSAINWSNHWGDQVLFSENGPPPSDYKQYLAAMYLENWMTFVFLRVRVEGMCIPRYSRLNFDFCSFADAAGE